MSLRSWFRSLARGAGSVTLDPSPRLRAVRPRVMHPPARRCCACEDERAVDPATGCAPCEERWPPG